MALEFRLLNEEELEMLHMTLNRTGSTCTGASYVQSLETYYIDIAPHTQATPSLRAKLARALGTQNLVINGRVA